MPILHFPIFPTLNHGKFCSPILFVFISFGFYFAILSILTGSLAVTHVLFPVFLKYSKLNTQNKRFKARIHVCETTYATILSTAHSLFHVWPAGDMCPLMPLGLPTFYYLDVNSVPRGNLPIVWQNGHGVKLHSKYLCLYPWFYAALNFVQRNFFLQ